MIVTKANNFRDIFSKNEEMTGIVIPKVQRDYAQGRKSDEVNRIRNRFLDVLYDAVVKDIPTTLDFIYGNIEDGKMIPLDGQQRLTTLYLLHYYVSKHESVNVEECRFLENFTYDTRISSREFCKNLIGYTPDFNKPTLSDQITDEAWFLLEWDNDPTVQAMLVMLDAIHEKFISTNGIWEKLTGDSITFFFLPLDQMGVTDELYIKMNSRGKLLSPFEHFKAELELRMKEVNPIIANRITPKIDREWTDLLWPYRDSGTNSGCDDEVVDDEFLRYIHFISDMICYKNGCLEITDNFEIIEKLFSINCENAEQNILLMERWFDLWVWYEGNNEEKEKNDISAFFDDFISKDIHQPNKILVERRDDYDNIPDLFHECCRNYGRKNGLRPMFPLGRSILLYSFLLYLEHKNTITDTDFRRRLRIVNNLVKNSQNTLRSEYMQDLLLQVDKIILSGYVGQVEEGKGRFQTKQMEEEAEKLRWTTQHPEKAELLFKMEDHKFLNGYIDVIGLDHVDWCERLYNLFECNLSCVNRAMLAIGDYFEEDGWRYQIGTANPRSYLSVWRSLFSPTRKNDGLKQVLSQLLSQSESFSDESLDEITRKYLNSSKEMPVRYYLAKYSSMLPNKFGKYFWRNYQKEKRNSYKVIMMTTEFNFGFNYDIFLKTLYDIAGSESAGLLIGNYSYSEYNNGGKDKLRMTEQKLFLTLDDNIYTVSNENNEEIESRTIAQNEKGLDIEDRVLVGLQLLNKYMNLYDDATFKEYADKTEWI